MIKNFLATKLTRQIFPNCCLYPWTLNYNNCPSFSPFNFNSTENYSNTILTEHTSPPNAFSYGKFYPLCTITKFFSFIGLDYFGFHFSAHTCQRKTLFFVFPELRFSNWALNVVKWCTRVSQTVKPRQKVNQQTIVENELLFFAKIKIIKNFSVA